MKVVVAATQMECGADTDENIMRAEGLVREAASKGAHIIVLQELFEGPYFCSREDTVCYGYAAPLEENKAVRHFKAISRELGVVLPISFYERKNNARYNSVAVIDADGSILGVYRKTHIPCGPGYQEKFYFNPGDTGFKVWDTRYAKIGVGICWDQWYPETARCMALMGAELLLFPTAIGSEPEDSADAGVDSKNHWQMCMQGHSACNIMPVIASNRIGTEGEGQTAVTFYGSSFITNHTGEKVAEADRKSRAVLTWEFDLDEIAGHRASWGVFRDRRPEMYRQILTSDGSIF
ncbi:N-carbamoylputrescine amidase [Anaerobacterium chartisolvens]|uniref:N-carbamoylputrescine amidase n=1 Tax=Anaerobacterium chartisolvens TaxID=1297424 RepID=A0A369BHL5_9FIRM|nr:N-carbamoylputrescine amidase [Anaerobacterium chartisolvens]